MTPNKKQRDHIASYGEAKFAAVLARTAMVVRTDARLVGLDTIREPLELYAALKATGFDAGIFSLGAKVELPPGLFEICQDIAGRAIAAAKKRKSKAA